MVSTKSFCPFERITYLLIQQALPRSANAIVVDFGDFGSRKLVFDESIRKGNDSFSLHYTEREREKFLSLSRFEGKVTFIRDDEGVTRTFVVENAYMTNSSFLEKDEYKGTNITLSNGNYVAPEARVSRGATFSPLNHDVRQDDFRRFYGYFLLYANDDEFVIGGPAASISSFGIPFAQATLNGRKFVLYVPTTPDVWSESVTEQVEIVPEHSEEIVQRLPSSKVKLYVRHENDLVRILPAVDVVNVNGLLVDSELYLQVLKMAFWASRFRESPETASLWYDGNIIVDLVTVAGVLVLKDDERRLYDSMVRNNAVVKSAFADIYVGNELLYIGSGKEKGAFYGRNLSNTFVRALISLLLDQHELSDIEAIFLAKALISAGAVTIATNGDLVGNTAGQAFVVKSPLLSKPLISIKRNQSSTPADKSIVMYPTISGSDRYIYAARTEEGEIVIHDPFGERKEGEILSQSLVKERYVWT